MDKCEHIWLYIGNKRQKVWRCTLCDEYRLVTPEQKSQETLEGMQGEYVKPPSGSYTSWENTMLNPLGDMRTQTQNAWHDGYASAKVQRPWQGLTDQEIEKIVYNIKSVTMGIVTTEYLARAIEAKIKEKNYDKH